MNDELCERRGNRSGILNWAGTEIERVEFHGPVPEMSSETVPVLLVSESEPHDGRPY
jgi:hypothetical protein